MPSPRLTPCATPTSAPAMVLLFKVAAAIPMDCTSGTVFATRVAMARANRAVSAFSSASPEQRHFQAERRPTRSGPPAVRVYPRQIDQAAAIAEAAIHQ